MESLVCLKDHLEVTMSENKNLMTAVEEFASCLKSLGASATLAIQTDFFREQIKLLNRRIHENIACIDENIASIDAFVVRPSSKIVPQDETESDDQRGAGGVLEDVDDGEERTMTADENKVTVLYENGVTLDDKSSSHRDKRNDEAKGRDMKGGDKDESQNEANPDIANQQFLQDSQKNGNQDNVGMSHGSELVEEVAIMKDLRLSRLEGEGNEAFVKEFRRATVLEAVEYLCEDEDDKQRILKHLKETEDECTLRMLEAVICKKYVEVRMLQEDMRHKEEETLLRRFMEERENGTDACVAVCAKKPVKRWEEPTELLEMDLPIIRGEILYLIDEFDVEMEKFRSTVSEITMVQCALHEKNLEIHNIQGRLCSSVEDGNVKSYVGGKLPKRKGKEDKKAVTYKDIEVEFRRKYSSGWSKVPNLLRTAKERNVRLQGLINDHSLKIRTMVAELGQVRSQDREEIETELRKVVKKLHGAMEVVYAKSDEAAVLQYTTLKKLEELHESQEELLKVLAVICENLDAGGDMDNGDEGEVKLDELRGEIEYLESEFRVKNARTLDLIDRYQGVLTEDGAADSSVVSQVAYQANAWIAVDAPTKPSAETNVVGGFASFRRRISVLMEDTVGCKRGLLECIKQQEENDGTVKKLRQLVVNHPQQREVTQVGIDGGNDRRRLDCIIENQELQIRLLERKLIEAVERNTQMAADVDDILEKRTRQVEDLGSKLVEAEYQLEKNKDILEAVNMAEDLDPEKILTGTLKKAKARLSNVLGKIDSCSRRVEEMLEKADGAARRGYLQGAVKLMEEQQMSVNKKAHEFFLERKDNLYRKFVSKSSEFEEIHRELDEVRRAKVRLEGRGKGDVDELQRLLHEIKELKLQMLLNATLEKAVLVHPVGDVGQWLGQTDEQNMILKNVAQDCRDFEDYVSSVKDNVTHFQKDLRAAHCEVKDLQENLVDIILNTGDDEESALEEEEAEVGEEIMVKDLMTKILEGRVQKWQSGEFLGRIMENSMNSSKVNDPVKVEERVVREVRRESSVSRVETWQRSGEGSDQDSKSKDYCHKVLEMCLKVDIMQDNILNRLERATKEQPMDKQIGITVRERLHEKLCVNSTDPEPGRRTRTRWLNTDGLAGALLPRAPWQPPRPPPDQLSTTSTQLAKYAHQNTVLKALLKHSLTKADIYQEALAKTKVTNVDALPRHKWLQENTLLRDLVAQLMDEVFVLQTRLMVAAR